MSGQFPNIHFAIIDGAGTDAKRQRPQARQRRVAVLQGAGRRRDGRRHRRHAREDRARPKKNQHVISAVGGVSIPPVNHYIAGYKWAATDGRPGASRCWSATPTTSTTRPSARPSPAARSTRSLTSCSRSPAAAGSARCRRPARQASTASASTPTRRTPTRRSSRAPSRRWTSPPTPRSRAWSTGSFQGGALTFSIANDGAGYAVDNFTLPADIQTEVDKVQGEIKSGALTPPADIPA